MQVLRQALLQSLPAQIIQFTVIRNKILCLTQNQLILLCIDGICRKCQIPYNGSCVYKMEMSKDYIALLERTGRLEIRRVDNLSIVLLVDKNIKIVNNHYPRLKWWEDDLHLVYQKFIVVVNVDIGVNTSVNNNRITSNISQQKEKSIIQIDKQKHLLQLQFTDLFGSDAKSIFYVFRNEIKLTLTDITVASITLAPGEEIKQLLRLCHPFQSGQFNKQYLAILTQKTTTIYQHQQSTNHDKRSITTTKRYIMLKVYNILTLTVIYEKQIYQCEQLSQPIEMEMLTDQLSQYLLIKHYKRYYPSKSSPLSSFKRQVQTQTLLKVNSDYYYCPTRPYDHHYQSFIAFDIEIGLMKDMKLFLSHVEEIGGRLCESIDACYFENNGVYIVSIVLEVGYRNGRDEKGKMERGEIGQGEDCGGQEEFVIWRQLVEAKVNPKKFIQKLITASELPKLTQSPHSHPNSKYCKQTSTSLSSQSNSIAIEYESILQSLLTKLHKIKNFNQLNQKIDAYKTMKKILAIEYFPMLLDVMSIEKDQNKTQREILEKSNEDGAKTMSGCSSNWTHSPRSNNSGDKDNKTILNDLYIVNDARNSHQLLTLQHHQPVQSCPACQQIQDHQNLDLTLDILTHSADNLDNSLLKIQQSIYRLQTLAKHRLQRIEMRTRRQRKQSSRIVSIIQDEFHKSLQNLQSTMLSSALRFTQKITELPQRSVTHIKQKAEEFVETIQEKRVLYDKSVMIHRQNHEELLDYLYDIEFPEVGVEAESKAQTIYDYFNFQDVPKSIGAIGEIVIQQQSRDQQFRMFSEFVMRNFI